VRGTSPRLAHCCARPGAWNFRSGASHARRLFHLGRPRLGVAWSQTLDGQLRNQQPAGQRHGGADRQMDPLLNLRSVPGSSCLLPGVAQATMQGEAHSGDQCIVLDLPGGCLVAVADGLGHGPEAARAALLAMTVLREGPHTSVIQQIRKCHEALRTTRGVVLSLALFNFAEETVAWLGVGNVGGVLVRASAAPGEPGREYLLCRGGVVGAQLPALHAGVMPM